MKLVEFYPEKQGRPESKVSLDMEKRGPSIPVGYITPTMLREIYIEYGDVDNEPVEGETGVPISSDWAYRHIQEQDEKLDRYDRIIRMLLRLLWEDLDWEDVDPDEIDWEN